MQQIDAQMWWVLSCKRTPNDDG